MKVAEWTSSLVHCPKPGLFGWLRGASERGQRIGCTAAGTSLWGQAVCMPKPHNRGVPYPSLVFRIRNTPPAGVFRIRNSLAVWLSGCLSG